MGEREKLVESRIDLIKTSINTFTDLMGRLPNFIQVDCFINGALKEVNLTKNETRQIRKEIYNFCNKKVSCTS